MEETRKCNRCKRTKQLDEFPTDRRPRKSTGQPGRLRHCSECDKKIRNKRQRDNYDPLKKKDKYLKFKYGISLDQFKEMLDAQGGVCAICKTVPENKAAGRPYLDGSEREDLIYLNGKFNVDHAHDHCSGERGCPKCVRGILCFNCNTGIGQLGTMERLQAAMDYLKENSNFSR